MFGIPGALRFSFRGQVSLAGLLFIGFFLAIMATVVDVGYALYARSKMYDAVGAAARAGVSRAIRVDGNGCVTLDAGKARSEAMSMLSLALQRVRLQNIKADIRVHPDSHGGVTNNFPPQPVRLGAVHGRWETQAPGVGVYLQADVPTRYLWLFGVSTLSLRVFAASEVSQLSSCP